MGQKTNQNIIRINKTNEWNSKYIEKKPKDFYLQTIKDLEVKKWIYRFFKSYNLNVHNCKLNYLNNTLNIFISYQQTLSSIYIINNINKTQKIKFINNNILNVNNNNNKAFNFLTNTKNYYNYKNLIFKKFIIKNKNITTNFKKISITKRIQFVKSYKKYLYLKKTQNIKNLIFNNFLNKFFKNLNLFYNNKFININLVVEPLNNKLINFLNIKKQDLIKKKLIKLKKYNKNNFFKEGINLMFSIVNKTNSAYLLSKFISTTLEQIKYHNFFFKFIKTALTILLSDKLSSSNIKGIKIKIKGRLNKAPRAKTKLITIGNLPLFTIDYDVDYSETTSYTPNGTLGIKVLICYNNNKII